MRKVALITYRSDYRSSDCDYSDVEYQIVENITDWVEIEDSDFTDLYRAANKYGYILVSQPVDQKKTIMKCLDDFRAFVKKEEEKEKARQAQYKKEHKKALQASNKKKLERYKLKIAELEKEVGT